MKLSVGIGAVCAHKPSRIPLPLPTPTPPLPQLSLRSRGLRGTHVLMLPHWKSFLPLPAGTRPASSRQGAPPHLCYCSLAGSRNPCDSLIHFFVGFLWPEAKLPSLVVFHGVCCTQLSARGKPDKSSRIHCVDHLIPPRLSSARVSSALASFLCCQSEANGQESHHHQGSVISLVSLKPSILPACFPALRSSAR